MASSPLCKARLISVLGLARRHGGLVCPLCCGRRLRLLPDPGSLGPWWFCPDCHRAGDPSQLASRVWRCGVPEAARSLLRESGLGVDQQDRWLAVVMDAIDNRKQVSDWWRRISSGPPTPTGWGLLERLGLRWEGDDRRWMDGPAALVSTCLRTHLRELPTKKNLDRFPPAPGAPLVVSPLRDQPGRISGFWLLGTDTDGLPREWLWPVTRGREAGVCCHPGQPAQLGWSDKVLVVGSLQRLLELQLRHLSGDRQPAPVIAGWLRRVRGSRRCTRHWRRDGRRLVFWAGEDDKVVAEVARRAGGSVAPGDWPSSGSAQAKVAALLSRVVASEPADKPARATTAWSIVPETRIEPERRGSSAQKGWLQLLVTPPDCPSFRLTVPTAELRDGAVVLLRRLREMSGREIDDQDRLIRMLRTPPAKSRLLRSSGWHEELGKFCLPSCDLLDRDDPVVWRPVASFPQSGCPLPPPSGELRDPGVADALLADGRRARIWPVLLPMIQALAGPVLGQSIKRLVVHDDHELAQLTINRIWNGDLPPRQRKFDRLWPKLAAGTPSDCLVTAFHPECVTAWADGIWTPDDRELVAARQLLVDTLAVVVRGRDRRRGDWRDFVTESAIQALGDPRAASLRVWSRPDDHRLSLVVADWLSHEVAAGLIRVDVPGRAVFTDPRGVLVPDHVLAKPSGIQQRRNRWEFNATPDLLAIERALLGAGVLTHRDQRGLVLDRDWLTRRHRERLARRDPRLAIH